jgi:hypothetical protein
MWSTQIRRVGSEVRREVGKGRLRQLLEIGLLGLRGYTENLRTLLCSINAPIVCKPIAGSHGDDVMVFDRFDRTSEVLTRANKQEMHLVEFCQTLARREFPWLLQAKVRQHPALLQLHETSVNTARIITLLRPDGKVEILGAVLRIGIGSAEIDNTTGGGIAAPIDLKSGICGPATSEWTIRRLARHPDSDCEIEGFAVPSWDRMKQVIVDAEG